LNTNCGNCDFHTHINPKPHTTYCEYLEIWKEIDETCDMFRPYVLGESDQTKHERAKDFRERKNQEARELAAQKYQEIKDHDAKIIQKKEFNWNKTAVIIAAIAALIAVLSLIL